MQRHGVNVPALTQPVGPFSHVVMTGSSHCTLAPYWSQRLGKSEMMAYQASPRGGVLRVCMQGERVAIGGQAVTVLHGTLLA